VELFGVSDGELAKGVGGYLFLQADPNPDLIPSLQFIRRYKCSVYSMQVTTVWEGAARHKVHEQLPRIKSICPVI